MIDSFTGKYHWLSNFAPSPVTLAGIIYPTVEHAYQAAKTVVPEERAHILSLDTPGKAKRAGKKVTMRPQWDEIKRSIMADLCRQKFSDPLFKAALLETGEEELVEGNNWGDTLWGKVDGVGQNWLGEILMTIREEFR